ncbi:MAG: Na+/H+ antiporter [archaeon]
MAEALVSFIPTLLELLIIAAIVSVFTQKYAKLPYTVALLLTGLLAAAMGLVPRILLEKDLLFALFLPPLIFEATLNTSLSHFKENFRPILIYSVFGVFLSSFIVGFLVHKILGVPLFAAMIFGSLISATDPVAVISLFKQVRVPQRLSVIMEGESILNDGTSIVIFTLFLAIMKTGEFSFLGSVFSFFKVTLGGVAVGVAIGYLASEIFKRTDDHLIETVLSVILAYGSFFVAETLGFSGIVAVALTGLLVGNPKGEYHFSPQTKTFLLPFWEFLAFIINSLIFLIIGGNINFSLFAERAWLILVTIGVVVLARAAVVYGLGNALNTRKPEGAIPFSWQHVIFWGGLRGAIPLALVLSLPDTFAFKDLFFHVTLGVVFFTIVVCGTTIKPLIDFLRIVKKSEIRERYLNAMAVISASARALRAVRRMKLRGELHEKTYKRVNAYIEKRNEKAKAESDRLISGNRELLDYEARRGIKKALVELKSGLMDANRQGLLSEGGLDQEISRIETELSKAPGKKS